MIGRHVSTLPISTGTKTKLLSEGYVNCKEIPDKFLPLLEEPPVVTAADIWQDEHQCDGMPLFQKGLYNLLGGGLPLKQIIMVSGEPGAGKTNFCLQLCVDVQIPRSIGGAEGEALYICTDNGFSVDRLEEIAKGAMGLVEKEMTVTDILNGVHVVSLLGKSDFLKVLVPVKEFLRGNLKVKLIIIDSFSMPFLKVDCSSLERSSEVHAILTILDEIMLCHDVTIVLTCQLTTVLLNDQPAFLTPMLGEGLRHRAHIHLFMKEPHMVLLKSADKPRSEIEYCITDHGFRTLAGDDP